MAPDLLPQPLLRRYIAANYGGFLDTMSTREAWIAYLRGVASSTNDKIYQLEQDRLRGLGYAGTLADMWAKFFVTEGYTDTLQANFRNYFDGAGGAPEGTGPYNPDFGGAGGTNTGKPLGLLLALTQP